jgi:competence protein ComEC
VPANVLATPLLTPLTLGAMAATVVGLVLAWLQALAMPPLAWLEDPAISEAATAGGAG